MVPPKILTILTTDLKKVGQKTQNQAKAGQSQWSVVRILGGTSNRDFFGKVPISGRGFFTVAVNGAVAVT